MKHVGSLGRGVDGAARAALLTGFMVFIAVASGCGKPGAMRADADAGPDGNGRIDGGPMVTDARLDGVTTDSGPRCEGGSGAKINGQACTCAADCASGFCVDGVCCNTACTEGCKTCSAPGNAGSCVGIAAGGTPRGATTCAATAATTCGLDGKCDGAGSCRKHVAGTLCKSGSCDGDAVVGSFACDGAGRCKPGATLICVPFSCNPATGACYEQCTSSTQCVSGRQCTSGSCGGRMKGAKCEKSGDCASGFCSDGVCCNVACGGPCLSCALPNREGTCWPVDQRQPDPHRQCLNAGEASCGQTGLCDGLGGCAKFPRDTVCIPPTCAGNKRNTPGTCNGLGTCQAGGIQNCHPFRCVAGECTKTCETDADCGEGIACVNHTCGPKQNGQVCQAGGECVSGFCVDNVCCENACMGACRSCALASSPGRCMMAASGNADPRQMCASQAPSTCGTNGKCDGSGGCQKHPVNTVCADETCAANVFTPAAMCNANGQCVAPDALPCSPFTCNVNRCFNACTNDAQCVPPNTCINNSCGLKDNGASCTIANECKSGFCAQGVCCDQACTGACKSCIAAMMGVCSNVATGAVDPEARCADQGGASCGTNGRCEAGACQRYASGTPCLEPTCPSVSNLFTALSTCNGAGACVTPAATDCFPYQCGGNACKASCTVDADCKAPAVCTNGTCGLKAPGAACFGPEECRSGFCEQGFCCQTECSGICKSCGLIASRGTCTNKATGDTDARCSDMGPASCSTDGFCDGNGACRLYDASTSCAPPSCPTNQSALITGRTCDGRGVCQAASSIACAPYVCNGTNACKAACTSDGDCLPGNICDLQINRCGDKKRLGQSCTSTDQCLTGNACVDGVCCSSPSCGLCQACNVGTSAGNCAAVALGAPEPHALCAPNPPCGNTGACNGAGACQQAATTVSCGTASCSGSTFTPISHCNGSGACAPSTASSCSPYLCSGAACRTSCAADSDCLAPFTCQGTAPSRSCALKPNGLVCTAANQCISGNCIDGVCCGSASCPTCQACNVAGSAGMCAFMPAGAAAPAGQCPAAPPCGNTGVCNGAGACQQAASTVSCGISMACSGATFQPASFCSGTGACSQTATTGCGSYVCNTNDTCRTNCTADAHCANTSLYCTGNVTTPGSCVAKKTNGAPCVGGNECGTGFCTDGVCCTTNGCAGCQSCSVNGAGTCANVANGTADPPNCAANPPCGNTGVCVNGACQQAATSTACGTPVSCTGATFQPPSFCSGGGTCNQAATIDCGAYQCSTNNSCRSTCTADADCTSGNYCTGNTSAPGSCQAKKALGATCGAGNQCVSGNCVDGVCCSTNACATCQACNLAPTPGTCANVGAGGGEPHNRCAPNGACGNTGVCNGSGGCTQQPPSVACGTSASCAGTTYQPPSFCNGGGACSQVGTQSCSPYVCGTGMCRPSCDSDAHCASGYYCTGTNGVCLLKKSAGASCGVGNECTTGSCVDGVCCNASSCSTCQACNLPGSLGTCTTVSDNAAEPHGRCSNPTLSTCGNTGLCSGGVCAQPGSATQCAGASCTSASSFQPAGSCNGAGSCTLPSVQNCSPYLCGGASGCRNSCSGDGDCVVGTFCDGGSCAPKRGIGLSCASNGQCANGQCVDNVCCGTASCDACQRCDIAGSEGMCAAMGVNQPDPRCGTPDPTSCDNNGLCNGSGACQLFDVNTVCNTSCDGLLPPTFTATYCDGAGTCGPISTAQACLVCGANGCVL